MSDRKTEMIKLRCTPEEKARWQLEADRQGIGVSEMIRQALEAQPLVVDTRQFDERLSHAECSPVATFGNDAVDAPHCCGGGCGKTYSPQPVDTTGEVGSVANATSRKPWMYGGDK